MDPARAMDPARTMEGAAMTRNVALGRYYPVDSTLHGLDPRTKTVALVVYLVSVFIADDATGFILPIAALCLAAALSNVPIRFVLRGLKPILVVVVVTDIVNIAFVDDGLRKAIVMTLRMVETIWGSNILCLTTKPKDMAGGIEKGLGWMKRLGVPVHDFATMVSLAFRFIPILSLEASRIMDAQKARGADFENGGVIRRARALVPIVVPLFVSSFKKADDLAMAMDSRLYGSCEEHSMFKPLAYRGSDLVAYCIVLLYLVLVVLAKVFPCRLV